MTHYFITATGTGIGKTFFTCHLIQQWRKEGKRVTAVKPVISEFDFARPETSDTGLIAQALGLPLTASTIESISPWRFAAPLSPDMAARQEKRRVDFDDVVNFCRRGREANCHVIEGAGGVMSPLTETHTNLDLMQALNIPVILVTGSYLGTISHTLTALEALDSRSVTVQSIVMNESPDETIPLEETYKSLQAFTGGKWPIQFLHRNALNNKTSYGI